MARNSRKLQRETSRKGDESRTSREARKSRKNIPAYSIDIANEAEFGQETWREADYFLADYTDQFINQTPQPTDMSQSAHPMQYAEHSEILGEEDFPRSRDENFQNKRRGFSGKKKNLPSSRRTGLWKLFAAASIIIMAAAAVVVIYFSPWFTLQTIDIQGAHMVPEAQIIAQLGVQMHTPLVEINDLTVARNISANFAPIRKTIVHKKFPHTLVVQVIERSPIAITRDNQIIDAQGVLFGYKPENKDPNAQSREGIFGTLDTLPLLNTDAPSPADSPTRDSLQVFMALPPEIKRRVREIDAKSISSIGFVLDNKKQIIFGTNTDIESKNYALQALLTRPGLIYNVSSPNLPVIKR